MGLLVTTEEGEPLVHLRTGVGGRVDAFDTEDFEDMVGPPTIFLTGYPFEIFVGIVGDVTIFVVGFEELSVIPDWSGSLEGEKNDDMAIPCAIITHLRIVVSSFAVMAMHAGCSPADTEVIEDLGEFTTAKREEMHFSVRIEERFDSPLVGDDAFGEGELFAIRRTGVYDARVIKIAGKPHDFDFGISNTHRHRISEGC